MAPTDHPGVTGRAIENGPEPLLVRPRTAWRMLGCGNTAGYALLKAGEIDSFKDGAARKIVVASIHRYIERKLAAAIGTASESASPRRRGRPRLKGDADRGANAAPPKKLPAPTL